MSVSHTAQRSDFEFTIFELAFFVRQQSVFAAAAAASPNERLVFRANTAGSELVIALPPLAALRTGC
ncbi:MAG: hypothetical protein ACKO2L_15475 [Planctomycetaceae bacterium]